MLVPLPRSAAACSEAAKEKPGSAIASGSGKFVWDHRMTGRGRFSGGACSGFAQYPPRTFACKDVHALRANGIFLQGPVTARAHLRIAPIGLDADRAVSAMPLQ